MFFFFAANGSAAGFDRRFYWRDRGGNHDATITACPLQQLQEDTPHKQGSKARRSAHSSTRTFTNCIFSQKCAFIITKMAQKTSRTNHPNVLDGIQPNVFFLFYHSVPADANSCDALTLSASPYSRTTHCFHN
jgi:hypothetical protein